MPRLDLSTRQRVLALRQLGYSIKERLEQEDIIVTTRSLERLGKKFCDKGSVSYQLSGSKSNPTFSPVKIPYRAHSSLNTASR